MSNAYPTSDQDVRSAEWAHHALVVKLRHLPKRYSCGDLRQTFQDILLEIGARPGMKVSPSRCERALGAGARSPRIRLEFALPRPLARAASSPSRLVVMSKSLRLGAGHPSSLGPADCELLRQIKETLLAALPIHVLDFSLACMAPENARPVFGITVQALLPNEGREERAAFAESHTGS